MREKTATHGHDGETEDYESEKKLLVDLTWSSEDKNAC